MRRAARVDENQPEIVQALRDVGATVEDLSMVGGGCPDIACGFRGATYFLEIKDGNKPPSQRKLTDKQRKWHKHWMGHVATVWTVNQALRAIGAVK